MDAGKGFSSRKTRRVSSISTVCCITVIERVYRKDVGAAMVSGTFLAVCSTSHEKSQKSVKKSLFRSKNHKNNL
jgi:hypothetical protein